MRIQDTPIKVVVSFYDTLYNGALHTIEFENVINVTKNVVDLVVTTQQDNGQSVDHLFNKDTLVSFEVTMNKIKVNYSDGGMLI